MYETVKIYIKDPKSSFLKKRTATVEKPQSFYRVLIFSGSFSRQRAKMIMNTRTRGLGSYCSLPVSHDRVIHSDTRSCFVPRNFVFLFNLFLFLISVSTLLKLLYLREILIWSLSDAQTAIKR